MSAKSFLFITVGMETGQLVPIFAVAKRMVSRGHRVRMLLTAPPAGPPQDILTRAEATGCETSTITLSRDVPRSVPPVRQAFFGWTPERIGIPPPVFHRIHAMAPQMATRVADELVASPVDAVVADNFFPGASIGAAVAGVPAVSLVHSVYHSTRTGVIPSGAGYRPPSGPLDHARLAIQRALHRRLERLNALPGVNAARSQAGLAPVRSLAEHEDGIARVLVLSSPAFDFHPGPLPANVKTVGWPIAAAESAPAWASPWPEDDTRSLVLLSPSTTTQAQEQLPFFNRALAAMADVDARGLLTTGPSADPATLAAPANVVVQPFVPHAAVMPRASLVISHCGHGTVMTALSYGAPILCVPYGRDQYDVAARVVWAGAGSELSKEASTSQIRAALQTMLATPTFRGSAAGLARAMANENGADNAANEIEQVVDDRRAGVAPIEANQR